MNIKKIASVVLSAALVSALFAGCGSSPSSSETTSSSAGSSSAASSSQEASLSGTVKLSGSTSMEKLAKVYQEVFVQKNPNVVVDVQLGGSSTGIKNVTDGISDIGNSSRALKDTETGLKATQVAIDGISVVVSTDNTVKDLSLAQLASIYKGEVTNWKEVGGNDQSIIVVGRESGSGTRDGFEEIVGIKDQAKYGQELTETGLVKTAVASTAGAIGYISMAYVDETVTALTVAGVAGSEATVLDGSYPLQRPFLMLTKEGVELSAQSKAFLDFVTSDEGKQLAKEQKLFVK